MVKYLVDMIEDGKTESENITRFLYKDGKGNKGLNTDLTLEQCVKLLQKIEINGYDNYDEMKNLGFF